MKRLYIPLILELALIIVTTIWEKQSFYFCFAFYLGLIVYFYYIKKQFPLGELRSNFGDVKNFWIPVVITVAAMLLAYEVQQKISIQWFTEYYESIVHTPTKNEIVPLLFLCLMDMIMRPVAEGIFYRKAIISFDNKKKMEILTIVSLILCSITRAHGLVGIVTIIILALPVTIAYLVTKNIYVSIMAQIFFELYNTGFTTVYDFARIYLR